MMLITNLVCLGVGIVLGAISLERMMEWLGNQGRCELNVLTMDGKLHSFGSIDDNLVDQMIEDIEK